VDTAKDQVLQMDHRPYRPSVPDRQGPRIFMCGRIRQEGLLLVVQQPPPPQPQVHHRRAWKESIYPQTHLLQDLPAPGSRNAMARSRRYQVSAKAHSLI
ncbi:hypothetical protein H4S04_009351, partial [Coemansia sp. S16]